jgi:hypothetical protein
LTAGKSSRIIVEVNANCMEMGGLYRAINNLSRVKPDKYYVTPDFRGCLFAPPEITLESLKVR